MKERIILILFISVLTNVLNPLFSNLEITPNLTDKEKERLIDMRSEEKLAHDIYLALYEKWGLNIFHNIAQSEKRHVESIQSLLDQFEVETNAMSELGKFADPKFQKLYDDLLTKGSLSIEQAYQTGLLIEDLDISDLDKCISETKNEELKIVYNHLNRASARHLRRFYSILNDSNIAYSPVYLSKERFESILADNDNRGRNKGRMLKGEKGKNTCSAKIQNKSCTSKGNNSARKCIGSGANGRRSCKR